MSDDEAFIRAIVAASADEAPRLVYADWLDERGDPRGAYLRAETARPGDADRLRPLAAGLDPVWMARVTRPPVGVCFTHFRLLDPGPPVTSADVADFERRHGIDLPADYRAFLLNANGGRLDLSEYGPDGRLMEEADYVFHPLTGEPRWGSVELWIERREADFEKYWDPIVGPDPARARAYFFQFISVGRNPDYIYSIHLGVTGPVRGRVYYFASSCGFWPGYPEGDSATAETFAAYLAGLP